MFWKFLTLWTYANILIMLYVVLATMLMYLLHLMLPNILTFRNNSDYLNVKQLINRDINIPRHVVRIHSATENLKESLPIFFACAVLSIITGVDSTAYGISWIIFRIAYVICYVYKLNPHRSIVWFGSIICLVLMALNLI